MSPKMVIITIAILPMLLFNTKQTSAQAPAPANGMPSYGLGGYTMDDKDQQVMVPENARILIGDDDVNNYTTNDHADKQFKACRVSFLNDKGKDYFRVFYDEDTAIEGCTVDFVFNETDRIRALIGVTDVELACLEDCGGSKGWTASNANLVPFTYSRSNEEIKTLHSGPPYNEDQKSCEEPCTENGGKCMASPTSLQIAWNKCKTQAKVWIHLVGEPLSSWSVEQEVRSGGAAFRLFIVTGDKPTITIENPLDEEKFVNEPHGTDGKPVAALNCFTDDKLPMIPLPKFWKINSSNPELNGKRLFVFHLLPQAATRVFNERGQLQNAPALEMPKCKGKLSMFIYYALGILQSVPPESTTTQTTEMTPSGEATNSSTTTATNREESETTGALENVWMIIAAILFCILLLVIVIFLVWCICCRNKKKQKLGKDAEMGKAPVKVAKKEADDEDTWNSPYENPQKRSNRARDGVIVPDTVQSDPSEREEDA